MWKELAIILFMAITGISWVCYQLTGDPITATDAAFGIFIEVLGTGLTILVLDQIWHYEERKRWKAVKDNVMKSLSNEIDGIFTDFASILIPLRAFQGETTEEIWERTLRYQLEELTTLAEGEIGEIQNRLLEEEHLLEGNYGELFGKRYSSLSDMEMKYGRFLEPSIRRPLIDLQRLLRSLAGNIRVRLKLRGTSGEFLIPSIESKIFHRVHGIIKILDEFKNLGLLAISENPTARAAVYRVFCPSFL